MPTWYVSIDVIPIDKLLFFYTWTDSGRLEQKPVAKFQLKTFDQFSEIVTHVFATE